MNKRRRTVREKIEICEVVCFCGIMGAFLAGFGKLIFGVNTSALFYLSMATFLAAGWKGGLFTP